MPLPADCSGCTMRQPNGSICRRHAPGPGREGQAIAVWPIVRPDQRCGEGKTGASPVSCGACLHWWQPPNQLVGPSASSHPLWGARVTLGRDAGWWQAAGLCTRYAASPSIGADQPEMHHRVTHGTLDGCGDGEAVPTPSP